MRLLLLLSCLFFIACPFGQDGGVFCGAFVSVNNFDEKKDSLALVIQQNGSVVNDSLNLSWSTYSNQPDFYDSSEITVFLRGFCGNKMIESDKYTFRLSEKKYYHLLYSKTLEMNESRAIFNDSYNGCNIIEKYRLRVKEEGGCIN